MARMEEGRSAFKILTGKPTGKRHSGIPSHTLKEIGISTRNWVDSAKDRGY